MSSFDPVLGPLHFITDADQPTVLAIITSTEGPAYRSAGAVMAIAADRTTAGSLSSGCIEADIVCQAMLALDSNRPMNLRYGQGSAFIDLRLPCGGALEILLLPRPDRNKLRAALQSVKRRIPQYLEIDEKAGDILVNTARSAVASNDHIHLTLYPRLAFRVFGNGAEVDHFASLAGSLGYDVTVFSPDADAVSNHRAAGRPAHVLKSRDSLPDIAIDQWTAAVLFFHDHDWEPAILRQVLDSDAFYIGAQGSHMARMERDQALRAMGVADHKISQITGPIGLIPSVRDPRSLAVSVLAEILARAQGRGV
jgi:xanthine dehydrogenase accessory factor